MSKQYWIMDPSKTSIFISFDRRGEAEEWLQEKEAFVKSKDSILHGAHIVETESPKSKLEQLSEILGPAIEAAREREKTRQKGYLLNCPFCGESSQLVESSFSHTPQTKAECTNYELGQKCPTQPETLFLGEADDGIDECVHAWNNRPEQERADKALIAAGEILDGKL